MLFNAAFSRPSSSFETPVPAPGVDPGADRLVCVSFNEKWLPYVIGSLKQLLLNTTFDVPIGSESFNEVQQQAASLINRFSRAQYCKPVFSPSVEIDEMSRFRVDPANNCILQIECAPDQWETFWDISTCVTAGSVQAGPGGSGPGPGQTQQHCLTLAGNGKTLLPIVVSTGDVITITDANGGWNDGTTSWYCPDGSGYTLGACVSFCGHNTGDPSPTACHMSIVAEINGVIYPTDAPIIVPAGVSDASVVFYANDANLSDNSGSVAFCVNVQNQTQPTFTHHFDFRTGLHGWTIRTEDATAPFPTYVPGTGVVGTNPSGAPGQGIIEVGLDMPRSWAHLHVRYAGTNVDDGGGQHGIYNMVSPLQWNSNIESFVTHTGPTVDFSCDFTQVAQAVKLNMNLSTPGSYQHTITDCWITGPGDDPFTL